LAEKDLLIQYLSFKYDRVHEETELIEFILSSDDFSFIKVPSFLSGDVIQFTKNEEYVLKLQPYIKTIIYRNYHEAHNYKLLKKTALSRFLPNVISLSVNKNYLVLKKENLNVLPLNKITSAYLDLLPDLENALTELADNFNGFKSINGLSSKSYYRFQYFTMSYLLLKRKDKTNQSLLKSYFLFLLRLGNLIHKDTPKINQALNHNDLNPHNMFLNEDDRLIIIDWESLAYSPINYDLAYHLGYVDLKYVCEIILHDRRMNLLSFNSQFVIWNILYFSILNDVNHDKASLNSFLYSVLERSLAF